ncbi:MAG: ankyrin repeat domain-containing protein, partial [Planctomycetota bacterium]|nr:ankyrin repeat domain-containing protein [Planctomycetota bacterium]
MSEIIFPGKASDFLRIGVAAAGRGDVSAVRQLLKARPAWLRRVGSHGRTMLWEASHRGKLEMVKCLVRRGADIDACGTHYTPYFVEVSCYCIARFKKRHPVADFLLKKGAEVNIHTAAFLGKCALVESFLKKKPKLLNEGHPHYQMGEKKADGLDFYLAPAPWATPLCYALRGADVETVSFLIGKGARIKGNEEALFIAAKKNIEMVRLLLENGADPTHLTHVYSDEGDLYDLAT